MKVFGCEPGANALSFISSLSSSLASKVMSLGDNYSARQMNSWYEVSDRDY